MKKHVITSAFLLLTLLYFFLFYKESAGLNVLIFESALFATSYFINPIKKMHWHGIAFLTSSLLSAFFILLYGSDIASAVNITSFVLLMAYRSSPVIRSPWLAMHACFTQISQLPLTILKRLFFDESAKTHGMGKLFYYLRITLLPLLVALLFMSLYMAGHVGFRTFINTNAGRLIRYLGDLFSVFSFHGTLILLIGALSSGAFLFYQYNARIIAKSQNSNDDLIRKRAKKSDFEMLDLKKEFQSMFFLLILLNGLILVVNLMDLQSVWLFFEWKGEELKDFVHKGTYMLLIAVVFSIATALIIFRENINFYPRNKGLKLLTTVWLFQNVFLVLSVAKRTAHYIQYFNLAHLRIGLLYFLVFVIVFILFVFLKINYKKSSFYLIRQTSISGFIIFFMLCPFDWDKIIVSYNFTHRHTGYVHKDWTMTLSDKTLPIIAEHMDWMDAAIDSNSWHYLQAENYRAYFMQRRIKFIDAYEKRGFASWNWADAKAYRYLKTLDTSVYIDRTTAPMEEPITE